MAGPLADQIAAVVAAEDLGVPSAARRGRNPDYPYVPIVDHGEPAYGASTCTEQIMGKAFAQRDDAVAHAAKVIEYRRASLATRLVSPSHRALREAHGLPRDLP